MSMPDVFLPLLFKVNRYAYDPGAVNDLGNEVEAWKDPEELDVYGWGPPQLQTPKEVLVGTTRYVVAVELMVPPGVIAKDNDRFQLGSIAEVLGAEELIALGHDAPIYEWYRVVGPIEDYTHNPFEWNPGGVINLTAVKGAKI